MLQASFSHSLGHTRAGSGTRLWLEGQRLLANGFNHRKLVSRQWSPNKLVLTVIDSDAWSRLSRANRTTIAGTVDRPIIDITGQIIRATFPSGQVIVSWSHNSITIEGI